MWRLSIHNKKVYFYIGKAVGNHLAVLLHFGKVVIMTKLKKISLLLCLVLTVVLMCGITTHATGSGDVAGAIEDTWNDASDQIKTVVNKVVFPAIDLILAVFFFAKLGTTYFEYRKHGQFEWGATRS